MARTPKTARTSTGIKVTRMSRVKENWRMIVPSAMRKAVIRRRQGVTSKQSRTLNDKVYHITNADRASRPTQKKTLVTTP